MVTVRRPPLLTSAGSPSLVTAAQATARGISRHRQRTLVRRGVWLRLHPGVYCVADAWQQADRQRQAVLLSAAAQCCWAGTVVSHLSAAAVWDLPLPLGDVGRPWLTVDSAADPHSTRRRPDVRIEAASLPPGDVLRHRVHGLPVTSLARTVADCLRHLSPRVSVPIADAAATRGLSRAAVMDVLDRQTSWPYAERAAVALPLIDPRRESWLESIGAVVMAENALPLPQSQVTVRDVQRHFIGRVDAWLPDSGVFIELDGFGKYREQGLASVADAERVLRAEKDREDRLRQVGPEIVRAGVQDVLGTTFVERCRRASQLGDPRRIRGFITPAPWPTSWPAVALRR